MLTPAITTDKRTMLILESKLLIEAGMRAIVKPAEIGGRNCPTDSWQDLCPEGREMRGDVNGNGQI